MVSLKSSCTVTHVHIGLIITGGTILTWIGATFICICQFQEQIANHISYLISNEFKSYCRKCTHCVFYLCSFYYLKISCSPSPLLPPSNHEALLKTYLSDSGLPQIQLHSYTCTYWFDHHRWHHSDMDWSYIHLYLSVSRANSKPY